MTLIGLISIRRSLLHWLTQHGLNSLLMAISHWRGWEPGTCSMHLDASVAPPSLALNEGNSADGQDRQGSEPRRGEKENSVQTDFVNLDQDFWESDARWFIASIFKPSIIWEKVSWWNTITVHKKHNYIETQLMEHVISSKKMASRDRLPMLA